ncbi:MAG TPA: hypothetical protein VH062_30050 [Polyangiaceae bacterium]|jgi:hypothetical protein|nr:hypothetical protein [Polyangiaceae bacterium]
MARDRSRQFKFWLSCDEWEALEYISAASDASSADLLRAFIVERYNRLRSPWLADLSAVADELRSAAARVQTEARRQSKALRGR